MRKSLSRVAVVGTGLAAVSVTGVAFAAWSVSGATTNTNNGKATHVSALTVSASATSTGWYPQLSSVSVPVTVTNTNPFHISVTDIKVTGYTSSDATCATDLAAAPAGVFSGDNTAPGLSLNNSASSSANVSVSASNDLPNSCQDQNITITFTATGASSNA